MGLRVDAGGTTGNGPGSAKDHSQARTPIHTALPNGGNINIGERAVGCLETQSIGKAARARGNTGPAIHIEQVKPNERRSCGNSQGLCDVLGRNLVGYDEGKVDVAGWVAAERPELHWLGLDRE